MKTQTQLISLRHFQGLTCDDGPKVFKPSYLCTSWLIFLHQYQYNSISVDHFINSSLLRTQVSDPKHLAGPWSRVCHANSILVWPWPTSTMERKRLAWCLTCENSRTPSPWWRWRDYFLLPSLWLLPWDWYQFILIWPHPEVAAWQPRRRERQQMRVRVFF